MSDAASARKVQTNLRLTPSAKKKLRRLCTSWGVASQANVMEMLIKYADDDLPRYLRKLSKD